MTWLNYPAAGLAFREPPVKPAYESPGFRAVSPDRHDLFKEKKEKIGTILFLSFSVYPVSRVSLVSSVYPVLVGVLFVRFVFADRVAKVCFQCGDRCGICVLVRFQAIAAHAVPHSDQTGPSSTLSRPLGDIQSVRSVDSAVVVG